MPPTMTSDKASVPVPVPVPAESSTTTAVSAASAASAPPPARAQHKTPEQTVQMSVLGMDGTDLEMPPPSSNTNTNTNTNTRAANNITSKNGNDPDVVDDRKLAAKSTSSGAANFSPTPVSPRQQSQQQQQQQQQQQGKAGVVRTKGAAAASDQNWWGRVWGSKTDELGETTNYTSLGTPLSPAVASESAAASLPPPPPLGSTGVGDNGSHSSSSSASKAATAASTVEDQLRQDCSFFYQGIEDPIQQKRGAALTPFSTALDGAPRILSSRDGAIFHAKYQQLNQTILVKTDDLELTEETAGSGLQQQESIDFSSEHSSRNVNISDIGNSSLCYEQDGRLLMTLPCDQMRLIMDHDLEPGILSVEQWRCVDANEILPTGEAVAVSGPPLRYVMTVPDDLYRRVVAEMSYQYSSPFINPTTGGHADIRLAIMCLTVVLLLLFIGTMDWEYE
jgi:hypothetical protein